MTTHEIIFGDSRKMSLIDDNSVHLIVTSPPYWQLKDYGSDNQIGYNDTYEKYINNLNIVWKECYRILKDGCRLCINIGDQFARSVYYGRYKIIPIRDEIIRFCETIGLDFMGSIIWQKVTTCNTTGGASIMGSFPYPRNGIVKIDYEYILLFKKPGYLPKVSNENKEKSRLTNEEWNEYFNGHWYFTGAKQNNHLAMFPEELPKRLIKMFSFYGETVFDPFLGSGTTSLAAKNLGRDSKGYELNSDFKEIIWNKLNSLYLDNFVIDFKEDISEIDYKEQIGGLPYVFNDPVNIQTKINPKSLTFGSKIDKDTSTIKNNTFLVKNILSPEVLILDTGVKIKLLGIKSTSSLENDAINYLTDKVKGKRVFLKFDNEKYDDDGNLLAYIYLQNKTFINAHYLKSGFVEMDESKANKLMPKIEVTK
jgi:DNA modification methylase